ncbi:MAG: lysophospholipid acyltransferase family protein [Anaerolineales bacterium]|jgi:1-acyl-sn-glycerol-3-phosphate acyltransferase
MIGPQVSHEGPRTSILSYWVARILIAITGWQISGTIPEGKKFIFVGAPHTSNWDFMFMLLTSWIFRLKVSFMGKDALFRGPLGWVMRSLGGIPIDRSSHSGVVDQMVTRFNNADRLVVVVTPGGTRGYSDHWKSGFYWIAYKAHIPLICASIHYAKKRVHAGLSFVPTGNLRADMDRIRAFYEQGEGLYPHQAAEIRLKDEVSD